MLSVLVHPGLIQDRDEAKALLLKLIGKYPRLKKLWADTAYAGEFAEWLERYLGWCLEGIKKSKEQKAFAVFPSIGLSSDLYAWLDENRLLSKEYEQISQSSEVKTYMAMTHLMLRWLAPS